MRLSPIAVRGLVTNAMLGLILLIYLAAVWSDWQPWLRGWLSYPEGWSWPYVRRAPPPIRYVSPLLLGAIGAFLLWLAFRRRGSLRGLPLVICLTALVTWGYVWQLGLLGLKSESPNQLLIARITDENFTGYF